MRSALLALPFAGLALGGFRGQALWTPAAALILVAALREPLSTRTLRAWAPWLCWLALSAAASAQPLKGLPALARWAALAAYAGLARASWGEAERRLWLRGLWASASVLGLAGLWTGLHALSYGHGAEMTGLLPPYYNYTVFVEAAALASLAAALTRPRGSLIKRPALAWACAAALAALILLSRSRGGLLALAAGAAVVALRRGGWRRLGRPLAGLAALAGLVTILAVAALGRSPAFLLKLDKAGVFKRPQIWTAAARIAVDHPLAGEGPGGFESGFLRHQFRSGVGAVDFQYSSDYAHSELFQAAAETGLIGLALLALAFVLTASLPRAAQAEPAQEAALAALAAMAAHCAVDNLLQIPSLALLMLGAIAAASRPEPAGGASRRRAFALAALALLLVAWAPRQLADAFRRDAVKGRSPVALMSACVALYPADAGLREDLALARLGLGPTDGGYLGSLSPSLPAVPAAVRLAALADLDEASRLAPFNAVYVLERAELAESLGRPDEAAALARAGAALEPNCAECGLMIAESFARRHDKTSARAAFDEARRRAAAASPLVSGAYARRVCAPPPERLARVRKMIESRR